MKIPSKKMAHIPVYTVGFHSTPKSHGHKSQVYKSLRTLSRRSVEEEFPHLYAHGCTLRDVCADCTKFVADVISSSRRSLDLLNNTPKREARAAAPRPQRQSHLETPTQPHPPQPPPQLPPQAPQQQQLLHASLPPSSPQLRTETINNRLSAGASSSLQLQDLTPGSSLLHSEVEVVEVGVEVGASFSLPPSLSPPPPSLPPSLSLSSSSLPPSLPPSSSLRLSLLLPPGPCEWVCRSGPVAPRLSLNQGPSSG
ncbi:unnamed protein product [Pleuronectes platessa]|uniref:Uncharacterized protein n=1 Tax=Pleuronectes platessa TaxID=8262 RepID=A0A9N7YQL8_PLEPL|nr:unnamed protein product [Pleuronectes platessa]